MDKSRAAYFTEEEKTIILKKYEEFKHILQEKSYTAAAARKRKDTWQKITDCVNACNYGSVKRTWEQIKNKHKNIIQSANRKEAGKIAGGPPTQDYHSAEFDFSISNIPGGPLTEWGTSPDPNSSSQTGTFVKVEGESLLLLSPPTLLQTKVEHLDDKDGLSTCSERTFGEEGHLPPPELSSTSRPSGTSVVGKDTVRMLYKRSLELDIEYKKLKIRKIQLEVEKLEYDKKEREKIMKPPE